MFIGSLEGSFGQLPCAFRWTGWPLTTHGEVVVVVLLQVLHGGWVVVVVVLGVWQFGKVPVVPAEHWGCGLVVGGEPGGGECAGGLVGRTGVGKVVCGFPHPIRTTATASLIDALVGGELFPALLVII